MFVRDIRSNLAASALLLVVVVVVTALEADASPTPAGWRRQRESEYDQEQEQEFPSVIVQPFYSFYEQTKNFGQQAMERISDIGTTVGDFASDLFEQGKQQTTDFFDSGHEIVYDNIEQVKRFGEEGINFLKKAATDTSTFISDHVPNFSFLELSAVDQRDTYSGGGSRFNNHMVYLR